jgi:hypothetical protein
VFNKRAIQKFKTGSPQLVITNGFYKYDILCETARMVGRIFLMMVTMRA